MIGAGASAFLAAKRGATSIEQVAEEFPSRRRLITIEAALRRHAIHRGEPTNDLLAIKYLETLKGIADGQATKIFLPMDTGGLYGTLAGVAELFKDGDGAGVPSSSRPPRPPQPVEVPAAQVAHQPVAQAAPPAAPPATAHYAPPPVAQSPVYPPPPT